MRHNVILDHTQNHNDQDPIEWHFKYVNSHEGYLLLSYYEDNGSLCSVIIEWENREITSDPLSAIVDDNPVTYTLHLNENNFLENLGWQRFKLLAKREKWPIHLQNQAKIRSCRAVPRHKFRHEAPTNNNHEHAIQLDESNNNTKWKDTIVVDELGQQMEHKTYEDLGHKSKAKSLPISRRLGITSFMTSNMMDDTRQDW